MSNKNLLNHIEPWTTGGVKELMVRRAGRKEEGKLKVG